VTLALPAVAAVLTALMLSPGRAGSTVEAHPVDLPYVPGQLVVGYRAPIASVVSDIRRATSLDVRSQATADPTDQVITLPRGADVLATAARVRRLPGIAYAVPNYIAHMAGGWIPNDPGKAGQPGGWEQLQWNYTPQYGVDAPDAWSNLATEGHPGAKGVTVAVIDTGVAFRNWNGYARSPDFRTTSFVDPCDLVLGKIVNGRCTDPNAVDREGHGTFVAGVIGEETNNGVGLTGLAYGASIMPIRVLDGQGLGSSSTIATGIRYAVNHGAQVINLSLEFDLGVTQGDIPQIVSAISYAHRHGVVVVAAAGNDATSRIAYPAAVSGVISVGATTIDRCLAAYSDVGSGLDVVAPGGGDDSSSVVQSNCHPERNLPDVYQMTFNNTTQPDAFSLPTGWYGTSMAAPEVSAAAAMVIASGVIGPHPTPDLILQRLEQTADHLGTGTPNADYGYGLIDIGAATAPIPVPAPTQPTTQPTTSTATPSTATTASGAR
jgi:serine protease